MKDFVEAHSPGSGLLLKRERVLFRERSEYQEIEIFHNEHYGRVLILDGLVMTTEADGFIYHEALIHPLAGSINPLRRVLVVGGGDGGAVRELLRYPVGELVLLELDPVVVDACRKHLRGAEEALGDPRVRIIHGDAALVVKELPDERFDACFVDSSDPTGPAASLVSDGFYSQLRRVVRPGGGASVQAGSAFFNTDWLTDVKKGLNRAFGSSRPFIAPVPTYPGGLWCFIAAPLLNPDPSRLPRGLKWLNRETLSAVTALPAFLLELFS